MKHGFSLVELSIVLVILGLLTGGILAGQNLIRASELRSVSTQYQSYVTAVQTFRDKYFAIPGDITNATAFWGEATAGGSCVTAGGTGTQTCNGDGDGLLDTVSVTGNYGEVYTFWQHLSNAGLIEGSYTGKGGASGRHHSVIGENVPASKLSNAGWTPRSSSSSGSGSLTDTGTYNKLYFGEVSGSEWTYGRLLDGDEAWNIDKKIDDGMPIQGMLQSVYWGNCTTASNSSDSSAEYNLQNTDVCSFIFGNTPQGAF